MKYKNFRTKSAKCSHCAPVYAAQCGESPKMWKKYKNRKSATGGTKVNLKNVEFTISN